MFPEKQAETGIETEANRLISLYSNPEEVAPVPVKQISSSMQEPNLPKVEKQASDDEEEVDEAILKIRNKYLKDLFPIESEP